MGAGEGIGCANVPDPKPRLAWFFKRPGAVVFWALSMLLPVPPAAAQDGADADHWAGQLASDDVGARRQAVYELYQAGTAARPHVRAIAKRLRDPDDYVRSTAERVLARWSFQSVIDGLTPALPELLAALEDDRGAVRIAAVNLIWKAGPIPNVRGGAPPPDALVPALAKALADAEPKVRANAAACLLNNAPYGKPALPALGNALADEDAVVRLWAMRAAPAIDPAWAEPRAIERAADEDRFVRAAAAAALGAAPAPTSEPVRRTLASMLDDKEAEVQQAAVGALAGRGEPWAAPILAAVLSSRRAASVRSAAAFALGGTGDPKAVPLLAELLDEDGPEIRRRACWVAARIGPPAAPLAARLEREMRGGGGGRLTAALAVARVSPDAAARERAIGVLIAATGSGEPMQGPYLLRQLGPAAEPAREALRSVLQSDTYATAHAAAALLVLGGDDAAPAAAWFRERLTEGPGSGPISLLAEVGPAAAPLVPTLLAIARDPAHPRRGTALRAIRLAGARGEEVRAAFAAARRDPAARIRTEGALGLRALDAAD